MFSVFRYFSSLMKYHLMIACLCSLLIVLSTVTTRPSAAVYPSQSRLSSMQSEDVRALAPGAPVERDISSGQTHLWQVNLSAGDYLRLMVTRKTSKLAARLFAPGSKGVGRTDGTDTEWDRRPLLSTIDQNVIFEHDSNS